MDKYAKQLERALKAYAARGAKAIELLADDKWEEAAKVLRSRKAAFYNLRTADYLAGASAQSFYRSQFAASLWAEVGRQEPVIARLLRQSRKDCESQLMKIKKEKCRISKYRARAQNQNTFTRSI